MEEPIVFVLALDGDEVSTWHAAFDADAVELNEAKDQLVVRPMVDLIVDDTDSTFHLLQPELTTISGQLSGVDDGWQVIGIQRGASPNLLLADPEGFVYQADMAGDGDAQRPQQISAPDGEPLTLGYARFPPRGGLVFATPEGFKRVDLNR